jgi:hypothetical protein
MMQAADLRKCDWSSDSGRLNWTRVWAILVERQMRAGALIVIDVRGHVLRDGHIACCGFSKLNPRGFIGGFDRRRTPRPGCPG